MARAKKKRTAARKTAARKKTKSAARKRASSARSRASSAKAKSSARRTSVARSAPEESHGFFWVVVAVIVLALLWALLKAL